MSPLSAPAPAPAPAPSPSPALHFVRAAEPADADQIQAIFEQSLRQADWLARAAGTEIDSDQLRVTIIATGLSSIARRAQSPLTVVQPPVAASAYGLRTGTANLPMLHQPVQATGTPPQPQDYSALSHAQRGAHCALAVGRCQRRGAVEQRHGRDRDSGVLAEAG